MATYYSLQRKRRKVVTGGITDANKWNDQDGFHQWKMTHESWWVLMAWNLYWLCFWRLRPWGQLNDNFKHPVLSVGVSVESTPLTSSERLWRGLFLAASPYKVHTVSQIKRILRHSALHCCCFKLPPRFESKSCLATGFPGLSSYLIFHKDSLILYLQKS
mgnify:CR=1 FL=1